MSSLRPGYTFAAGKVVFTPSPFPFRKNERLHLRVFFFFSKNKIQILIIAPTPISRDHHPISGLGPSVDLELVEWDSNTLISLNSLSATHHPHPRKARAASQPFSVCRSYMNMITINCALSSSFFRSCKREPFVLFCFSIAFISVFSSHPPALPCHQSLRAE